MALSKQSILKHAGHFETREVHVKAWVDETGDDVVVVRGMSVREFELNQTRKDDGLNTASVISHCVIDPDTGAAMFNKNDLDEIAKLPLADIGELSKAIGELSGLTDDDGNEQSLDEAVTEAGNDSAATAGDGSSTA